MLVKVALIAAVFLALLATVAGRIVIEGSKIVSLS